MSEHLLTDPRKVQPRLRMIAGGSTTVNAIRSQMCGGVTLRQRALKAIPVIQMTEAKETALNVATKGERPPAEPKSLTSLPKDVLVSVFVEVARADADKVPGEKARRGNIVVATLPVDEINHLTERTDVVRRGQFVSY